MSMPADTNPANRTTGACHWCGSVGEHGLVRVFGTNQWCPVRQGAEAARAEERERTPPAPDLTALWDAVVEYTVACGGSPGAHVDAATTQRRLDAQAGVEAAARALLPPSPSPESAGARLPGCHCGGSPHATWCQYEPDPGAAPGSPTAPSPASDSDAAPAVARVLPIVEAERETWARGDSCDLEDK